METEIVPHLYIEDEQECTLERETTSGVTSARPPTHPTRETSSSTLDHSSIPPIPFPVILKLRKTGYKIIIQLPLPPPPLLL
ncbi:hypothetical protein COCSADRAFT_175830 [Bipolaris sorokiniana ND90Pr]|uniref:Uncharacterized protein n=1 Tax=Cochliobolus sativus (strain ND90Pr / ATCC 201652) TaxID=665912 RepID=M2SR73_COCSN|nr:uncharacterized protein COCSADRAFT_175830 [Bipolaris sorokiniana ND90Pr]EMD59287.1 hypothetical protein COCSADRAFT_175830 [Bipolaris sorokiniana ND90Pr]